MGTADMECSSWLNEHGVCVAAECFPCHKNERNKSHTQEMFIVHVSLQVVACEIDTRLVAELQKRVQGT